MTWIHIAQGVESIVTTAAIIFGGVWFVGGRTLRSKLLLGLHGEAYPVLNGCNVRLKVSVNNLGGTVVGIDHAETGVALFAHVASTVPPRWVDISALDLFLSSELIEPAETLNAEEIVVLPRLPNVALKVVFQFQSTVPLFRRRASRWETSCVISPAQFATRYNLERRDYNGASYDHPENAKVCTATSPKQSTKPSTAIPIFRRANRRISRRR